MPRPRSSVNPAEVEPEDDGVVEVAKPSGINPKVVVEIVTTQGSRVIPVPDVEAGRLLVGTVKARLNKATVFDMGDDGFIACQHIVSAQMHEYK